MSRRVQDLGLPGSQNVGFKAQGLRLKGLQVSVAEKTYLFKELYTETIIRNPN